MYRKVNRQAVPARERKSKSRFESTPEWRSMKADIDKGLKKNESCYLQLAPEDWERIGLSGEAQAGRNTSVGSKPVRRFIGKYLDATGRPYTVRTVHNDGYDYIIVDGPA